MSSLIKYQPFKALYTLFAIFYEVTKLPLWIILYIPKGLRPHSKWTHQQAIKMRIVKAFLNHSSKVEVRTPLSLDQGKEGDRFITISPPKADFYKGPLVDNEVRPEKIGGTWYPQKYDPFKARRSQEYVVLHLHGGAFVIGDGRIKDAGFCASTLIKYAKVDRVFAPQYRLSSNAGCRFPAPLQDAVTAYTYLLNSLHIPAHRIIVSGDSAGGNLALGLLRYIAEYGHATGLVPPAAAFLWSPWVNLRDSQDHKAIERNSNYKSDYLNGNFGAWGTRCFLGQGAGAAGKFALNPADPYVSPMGNPFKTDAPLFIQTGSAEVLFKDDVQLAEEFKSKGNRVELLVKEAAPHDIALIGHLVGFHEEARECMTKAGEFLRGDGSL